MSAGLYLVVDAISAIGAAAVASDKQVSQLLADATAASSAMAGMTGGSGGSGMGSTAGADQGPNVTGGRGGGSLKFGTTTVTPLGPGALIADLKSLGGRTPPPDMGAT